MSTDSRQPLSSRISSFETLLFLLRRYIVSTFIIITSNREQFYNSVKFKYNVSSYGRQSSAEEISRYRDRKKKRKKKIRTTRQDHFTSILKQPNKSSRGAWRIFGGNPESDVFVSFCSLGNSKRDATTTSIRRHAPPTATLHPCFLPPV